MKKRYFQPRFLFDDIPMSPIIESKSGDEILIISEKVKPDSKRPIVTEISIPNGIRVEVDGVKTEITVSERMVCGKIRHVTTISRTYLDGTESKEPEHFWDTPKEAQTDLNDWKKFSKCLDW